MEMTNRPIIKNGMKYFKCKKCGEVKPLNKSYFYVNMNTRLGFISKCISCVREEVANKPKVKYITRAELEKENKKLKEKIKRLEFDVDAWHQLKLLLEGEIEKLRGLQICGKSVAEWIEEDKNVVRVDKNGKVINGGEFKELC